MKRKKNVVCTGAVFTAVLFASVALACAKETSYAPVAVTEEFDSVMARMKAARPEVMERQMNLLEERYDLSDKPAPGVTMSRGKSVQEGVRVKLPAGMTWQKLAAMSPEEIRRRGLFPEGFLPLPHPNHAEGGMVFPQFVIDEINRQEGRDLTRFDLDFDLPDHFLPEFPAAIFLTTRPDLGDVSQGRVVTINNYYKLFNGILNPKQLEGLRLLVTPFPQQQFNQTDDRRSEKPSRGVTCFDGPFFSLIIPRIADLKQEKAHDCLTGENLCSSHSDWAHKI
jgi:cytochrome c peroxidase